MYILIIFVLAFLMKPDGDYYVETDLSGPDM